MRQTHLLFRLLTYPQKTNLSTRTQLIEESMWVQSPIGTYLKAEHANTPFLKHLYHNTEFKLRTSFYYKGDEFTSQNTKERNELTKKIEEIQKTQLITTTINNITKT
jgi:hypothetical protein